MVRPMLNVVFPDLGFSEKGLESILAATLLPGALTHFYTLIAAAVFATSAGQPSARHVGELVSDSALLLEELSELFAPSWRWTSCC